MPLMLRLGFIKNEVLSLALGY